ncbi:SIS domain-containing protein [Listeria monocytogenes]|nr:SIS domain-containing protein [Listeria monocytogenes]
MDKQAILDNIHQTWQEEANAISRLPEVTSEEALVKTVETIAGCTGKIVVAGCGTSGVAAKKLVHSFNCIERPAVFLTPSDAVHGTLGVLQKEDILILISKGGNTGELLNLIPACKTKGSTLIGVTENPDSVIAKEADIFFSVSVSKEPDPFNMLATASTMAVIASFDAVIVCLMTYMNYTKEQFSVIHPGGAVGNKLLNK